MNAIDRGLNIAFGIGIMGAAVQIQRKTPFDADERSQEMCEVIPNGLFACGIGFINGRRGVTPDLKQIFYNVAASISTVSHQLAFNENGPVCGAEDGVLNIILEALKISSCVFFPAFIFFKLMEYMTDEKSNAERVARNVNKLRNDPDTVCSSF